MLPLDVPFIADVGYPQFLADRQVALSAVHFSLHNPSLADARQRLDFRPASAIISGLNLLDDTPRYVLMNARLHAPDKYFDQQALEATAEHLAMLKDSAKIDGLIFTDAYYLQALSDAHPELAQTLEAVPSVNTIIDSAARAFAMLDMIAATAFKPPAKLVLDRALNRDIKRLEATSLRLRDVHPTIKLYLLANEGCLHQCPYKLTHDAHVALVNEALCHERTFAMNREFGCIRRLLSEPGTMLASPFIRPEDTAHFEPWVDGIKLCGRNRGATFLQRAVTAYMDGHYDGNLLDLMDAMGDLADQVDLRNSLLPKDFITRVTTCAKSCRQCGWCADLAQTCITRSDPGIPHF